MNSTTSPRESAFRCKPTEKTVLRAGYSMQYFQPPYMLSGFMAPMYGSVSGVQGGFTTAAFTGTFGPTVTSTITAPSTLVNGASAGNLPATVASAGHLDTPYVQSFNLQLQQEFYWGTVLSVGYVGALDRHLPCVQELNAATPGAGIGRPAVQQLRPDGQHARLRQRPDQQLQLAPGQPEQALHARAQLPGIVHLVEGAGIHRRQRDAAEPVQSAVQLRSARLRPAAHSDDQPHLGAALRTAREQHRRRRSWAAGSGTAFSRGARARR